MNADRNILLYSRIEAERDNAYPRRWFGNVWRYKPEAYKHNKPNNSILQSVLLDWKHQAAFAIPSVLTNTSQETCVD